jgi:hypothetical protein
MEKCEFLYKTIACIPLSHSTCPSLPTKRDAVAYLFLLGIQHLLEWDAELLAYWLQFGQVLLVLALVLCLVFDAWVG